MRQRIVAGAVVTFVALGGITACSDDDKRAGPTATVLQPGRPGEPNKTVVAGPTSPAPPTAAEIRFVQMMIPHHQQAVDMSELVPKQAADARVKALASRINLAQAGEIKTMKDWLRRHRKEVLRQGKKGHGHDGSATSGMPGMATKQQIERLGSARGADFDRLYLTLMIPHHQGALIMTKDVLSNGSDVTVQGLAREVVSSQQPEINRMRDLLAG